MARLSKARRCDRLRKPPSSKGCGATAAVRAAIGWAGLVRRPEVTRGRSMWPEDERGCRRPAASQRSEIGQASVAPVAGWRCRLQLAGPPQPAELF